MIKFLVGADPEIFMYKGRTPISAHGAVQGTKKNPLKVKDGAVQVDGMALEFNIDPADTPEMFSNNIESVLQTLREMVPEYSLKPTPVAEFGEEYIRAQPLEALVLGCDPDFNAWKGGKPNLRPDGELPFRTGAGHVHIGWTHDQDVRDPAHLEAGIMLTKQLDFFLGLPSLLYDKSSKRRTMYGAPGAFRPKPYGVEYRVLSNAWLGSKELMQWVFSNTVEAATRLIGGNYVFDYLSRSEINRSLRQMTNKRPNKEFILEITGMLGIPLPPFAG